MVGGQAGSHLRAPVNRSPCFAGFCDIIGNNKKDMLS
jgi:hypothetical protein